ncbi:P-loop containing nucleoside triphosphate hydrolase protein [Morchella snyderi]|nr:P-loop containing nucleoside triphosphate hydrolase protein [Morchella snyderi]
MKGANDGESQDGGIGSRYTAQRSTISSSGPIAAIMLCGKTGSGKSSFIRLLGGLDVNGKEPVSDGGLESCTTKPMTYVTKHNGRTVLLLDTPGFDDSAIDNLVILNEIVSNLYIWALQDKEIHTHGVLFLHDISETRFGGSQQKTLQLLKAMCGPGAMGNVIIGTTMWSDNGAKHEAQVKRESEFLRKHWGDIHKTVRVPEGDEDIANSIIGDLLARPPTLLLVQTELLTPPHTCEATTVGKIAIPEGKREAERLAKELEEQKLESERLAKEKEEQREKERADDRKRNEEEQARIRAEMKEAQERSRKEMEDRLEEEKKKHAEEREKNAEEERRREEERQRQREEFERRQRREMEELAERQRREMEEIRRKQEEERRQAAEHMAEMRRRQEEEIAAANRRAEEAMRNARKRKGKCSIIVEACLDVVGKMALGKIFGL